MPQRLLLLCLTLLAAALVSSAAQAAPPAQKPSPNLFEAADDIGVLDTAGDPTIVRSRLVTINDQQLPGANGQLSGSSQADISDVITLNLFDDVSYQAALDTIEPLPAGGYVWVGHLLQTLRSQVIFVVNGGQAVGNVALPGQFYGVRFVGQNIHAILEIDQSAFPGDIVLPVDEPGLPPPPLQANADSGSQIDVLVAYTAIARQNAGGTTAIQNLINLAVTETNQSYANSGIIQRINLVHTVEVSYGESGNIGLDLSRLENTADGYIDNVHALRNTHAADLVMLLVENGGSSCGIAYLMTSVSGSFEDDAFSVVDQDCATGYYSFGHELGHNMGARHDWYVDSANNSPFSYNHGYVNTTDRWRTVMAYNTECANGGVNCTRLPYWSNPNVIYGGDPMGIPEGQFEAADNRKTLNNTAYTVANFRVSSTPPPATGPLVYSSHLVDDNATGDSNGDNDGVVECGETIEMWVSLFNQGSDTALGVDAIISTGSPYVNFPFNTSSSYGDISGGATAGNSNDFDFSVDPTTPDGHQIQFDLNITAGNGGPWNSSFVVPVACAVSSGDSYEPDDNNSQASPISSGAMQTHSIYPTGDEDWVTFSLDSYSALTLATAGAPGNDTRLWLYDSSLNFVAYNDDIDLSSGNLFSEINRTCESDPLPPGVYYARVDEYNDNDPIYSYNLSLALSSCQDEYEPDDVSGQATWLLSYTPQTHSIIPEDDIDWLKFNVSYDEAGVTLETSGAGSDDTRLWLYSAADLLNAIEYNDDGGVGYFSRIERLCDSDPLTGGDYYAKIDEFSNNNIITTYTIEVKIFSCNTIPVYLPLVIK